MSKKIPDKCPLINSCVAYIDVDTFDILCDSEAWIGCDRARDLAKRLGFLKKPREWAKEVKKEE